MLTRLLALAAAVGLLAPASAGEFTLNQADLAPLLQSLKTAPAAVVAAPIAEPRTIQAQAFNDRFEREASFHLAQRFDELLTRGVKASAEKDAWTACRAANNTCELAMSEIESCNQASAGGFDCRAKAVAYAGWLPPLYDRFDAEAQTGRLSVDPTGDSDAAKLERLGAQGKALDDATAQCRQSGKTHCAPVAAGVDCPAGAGYCSATARVFGWK